jgi:hypothetical protein
MKNVILVAGAALLLAGSSVGAQPVPSGHSQHHTAAKPSRGTSSPRCASEEQMREMMGMMQQMMQMHQQMMGQGMSNMPMHQPPMPPGTNMPMQPMAPGQNSPPPGQHQH